MGLKNLLAAGLVASVLAGGPSISFAYNNKDNAEEYELILKKSKKNKVVIFGEMHGTYRSDNDFVTDLLPDLKKAGFNYLAIELPEKIVPNANSEGKDYFFVKKEGEPNLRKIYRLQGIEDYMDDKVDLNEIDPDEARIMESLGSGLMELIRTAKSLDMATIRYDAPADIKTKADYNTRDKIAFNNLKRIVFDKDSDARVVVYAGALHANKKRYDKTRWLAARLNSYMKGRVLSVSLVPWGVASCPSCDIFIVP